MSSERLQKWALTAEIIGGAAVIVSLVFVGLQIRQSVKAQKAATRQAINQRDIEFLSLRLDSSVLARAHAKFKVGEDLSHLEETQLVFQEYVNFVIFEHSYYQFTRGLLEAEEWARHKNITHMQMRDSPFARMMWEQHRETFTPEFQEIIEGFELNDTP